MTTSTPTSAAMSSGNVGAAPPPPEFRRMSTPTAPERASQVDAGAVEYASWLLLLRRRAP